MDVGYETLSDAIQEVLPLYVSQSGKRSLKTTSYKIVKVIFETIRKGLLKDGKVVIPSLGTFYVVEHKGRYRHHPKGYLFWAPEHKVVRFRPAYKIRSAGNEE